MTMSAVTSEKSNPSRDAGNSEKYLSFIIGEEEHGIAILSVREIMGVIKIASIPNVPPFVKGVINLRGTIIPIVDMRLKFGLPRKAYDKETCIIVLNLNCRLMGIIVDSVSEVMDIKHDDIDAAPGLGNEVKTDHILGLGKVKGKVVILLDIEKIFGGGMWDHEIC